MCWNYMSRNYMKCYLAVKVVGKKVYKTKKSCIGTKYPSLCAKCSSLKIKN